MSGTAKRFGTFGGVFTPSILTILGVIMYLRLPTIVGQGGLWMTLGIIAVAHVISITTGLSVASIATDKRVRAGGSYYMISRSLGLPIGGTLGIALFVGMSFSISLYLIGFSESFLGYWGLPQDKNTIRIAGSIALAVVAIVTLISTSLAMKTQYVIMAAIAASLATVVVGGFTHTPPAHPHMNAASGAAAVGFGALFGIFFPAVTGFEAGVSMSGDLKDPKKAIPIGTIAAIAVGLIVYAGLAIFLAFRIDAASLATDSDILSKISVFAPALMAGVWGATISSALGSILGAPRILQAASADRITHRFFARGYGPTSEPRNALIMSVLIAQAGILIGELDVIARIVTMFFITAYGFLNLACALESWASPDFRPDFRIPKSVSLVGAITCVVIMIQLDILAMIGASVVMGVLFVYLKRRELTLEGGDTYEGIWSTIVRRGLYNLSRSTVHQRNWRPNMLLFSGGEDERPGLVAIARDLASGRGMISNFDLEETSRARLRPRREEAVPTDSPDAEGVFTRVLQCRDVYESMLQISRYHGFSGVEPNTVLLGRAHKISRAEKFGSMVQSFVELDYNILLYDECADRNPAPQTIDVWWSGYGNNLSFGLSLVRFLHATDRWHHASLRFLIIADDAGLAERYRARLGATIDSMRVSGEIRVIYNGVERRNFAEIIAHESGQSDLVLLGIPDFSREPPEKALARMNDLTGSLREILWMGASSYFPEVAVERSTRLSLPVSPDAELPSLDLPSAEPLRSWLADFAPKLSAMLVGVHERHFAAIGERRIAAMERLEQLANHTYDAIAEGLAEGAPMRRPISHFHGSFLHQARTGLVPTEGAEADSVPLNSEQLAQELGRLVAESPKTLGVVRPSGFFASRQGDGWRTRARYALRRVRARFGGGQTRTEIPCRAILSHRLQLGIPKRMAALERRVSLGHYALLAATHRILARVDASLQALESARRQGTLSGEIVRKDRELVVASIQLELKNATLELTDLGRTVEADSRRLLLRMGADMDHPDASGRTRSRHVSRRHLDREFASLALTEHALLNNGLLFERMLAADLKLFFIRNRMRGVVERVLAETEASLRGSLLGRLKRAGNPERTETAPYPHAAATERPFGAEDFSSSLMSQIRPVLAELPEELSVLAAESVEQFEKGEFAQASAVTVAVRRYVESLCESNFSISARKAADALERAVQEARSALADALNTPEDRATEEAEPAAPDVPPRDRPVVRVSEAASALEVALDDFQIEILASLGKVAEHLSAFFFVHAPESIDLFVRASERRVLQQRIQRLLDAGRQAMANLLGRVLLRRSHAVVLAHRIENEANEWNRVSLLGELRENCIPAARMVATLPRYYRYLFLEKAPPSAEFWVGRKQELAEFASAVARSRSGFGGAVFVTGPPESGKTWFCRFAAERHFSRGQIQEVFVKQGGASREAFQEAKRQAASGTEELSQTRRCVVVHDLELLWERRPDGYAGLRAVLDAVQELGRQTLFVFNLNIDAFLLLRQTFRLESQTARAIELGPFTAEELQDVVLKRHNVTGYGLQLGAAGDRAISLFQSARYFDAIFAESAGLPGPALRTYVRSIESVQDNTVRIRYPSAVSDSVLAGLPPSWKLILATVLLHKRLRDDRLLALCLPIDPDAETILSALRHARILIPMGADNWKLEPAVMPYLRQRLREEGVL